MLLYTCIIVLWLLYTSWVKIDIFLAHLAHRMSDEKHILCRSISICIGISSTFYSIQHICINIINVPYVRIRRTNPCNPAFNSVFGTGFWKLFEARPNTILTLVIRLNQTIVDSEINLNRFAINSTLYIPSWVLKSQGFQLSLHLLWNKSEVSPTVYQSKFNKLISQYDGFTRIFTDGCKFGEAVGSAAIVTSRSCKKRLPNNSSIFSAEACGILLALDMIYLSTCSQLLFLSDPLSCLQSLQIRDLSPSDCRDFVSCAWSNIRWYQFCFYMGS